MSLSIQNICLGHTFSFARADRVEVQRVQGVPEEAEEGAGEEELGDRGEIKGKQTQVHIR